MRSAAPRNGEVARSLRASTAHDYLELWINLARREWGSLVIVPADRDGSTAEIANALADIGQRLSFGPVTAITVTSLEYGSALALADLQQHLERERRRWNRTIPVENAGAQADPPEAAGQSPSGGAPTAGPHPTGAAGPDSTPRRPSAADGANGTEALMLVPPARLIISVPPVVAEPLGLAAAEEADAVVLAVRMNHSRLPEVRRTIHLVGRERLAGCFLVR